MTQVLPGTDRRLRLILAEAQAGGRLPSVVAAVLREGEVVWSGERGRHTGTAADADPDDVQYRIGSITKTFTAVLILRLVRDGALDLDRPVGRLLGEIGYGDRTPRALLAHGSGMQSEPAGPWWERSPGVEWSALTRANDGSGAVFDNDERFHYSNLGYALLGRVVETVLARPWWDAVRDRILTPLGMDRTTYLPVAPAAQGYSVHPHRGTLFAEPATDTAAMAPAGQAWSTRADLARYAGFLVHGHPEVLSSAALLTAAHPQAGDQDHRLAAAHGLGFQLLAGGSGALVGHSGSMPGFLAACFADRPSATAAVVLANATTGFSPAELARELVETLAELEPALPPVWEPATEVPEPVEAVLGNWYWGNTPFEMRWEAGEVRCYRDGAVRERFELREQRLVGTAGYHAGETLTAHRGDDGSVSHLEVATWCFTRSPYPGEQ